MSAIKINNIRKSYDGKVDIIEKLDLEIKNGEFLVLVGPSGCGKSTLLRMIAGLEEITDGEIFIDDALVNDVAPKDRDIAMVFQNYALYPHMSVYQNLAFGLKLRKYPKNEIEKRVKEASAVLGLDEYLSKKPRQLSGGQKQRVAVGRALVRKPKVFLFDEPLSNLDAKLRTQMRTELLRLHQQVKTTMIYVTHDQTEAMTMADRIVVLKDGEIQQIDTPINLYNKPVNKFVAGFIGSPAMNFMEGEIKDNCFISKENISINLNDKKEDSKSVCLGIRPEHITIIENESKPDLEAVVELVELMGKESYLYMKSGEYRFILRINSELNIKIGEILKLKFNEEQIHIFDN